MPKKKTRKKAATKDYSKSAKWGKKAIAGVSWSTGKKPGASVGYRLGPLKGTIGIGSHSTRKKKKK